MRTKDGKNISIFDMVRSFINSHSIGYEFLPKDLYDICRSMSSRTFSTSIDNYLSLLKVAGFLERVRYEHHNQPLYKIVQKIDEKLLLKDIKEMNKNKKYGKN